MNAKKGTILFRCFMNFLVGVLASFLLVSAFAAMIRVEGDAKTFWVGTLSYSNGAETTYLDNTYMSGHLEIRNLSGNSAVGQLGVAPEVYVSESLTGRKQLAASTKPILNKTATYVWTGSVTVSSLEKGKYYTTFGNTLVYFNGEYVSEPVIGSPAIRAD